MLVTGLLLLTACFSSVLTYHAERDDNANHDGYTTNRYERSADYNRLLDLLYRRYKSYKRSHVTHRYDTNTATARKGAWKDLPVKRHLSTTAEKRAALRKAISSVLSDVATDEVDTERRAVRKTVNGAKRDTVVQLHSVTPVHDDDDVVKEDTASKRGFLPPMDMITPVHDDEMEAAAAAAAASVETATQKNIVPVHDDDDVGINSNGYRFGDRNRELGDDMKTFITVVEKSKAGEELDEDEEGELGKEGSEGFHDDNLEQAINALKAKSNVVEAKEQASASTKSNTVDGPKEPTLVKHEVKMPGVSPKEPDTYLCYAHKLPEDDQYIVEYRPLADKQTAHHMLLFACDEPFQTNTTWNCREMSPVCRTGGQTIMYAWAMNAPSLKMPTNVGFHVGGTSGYNYLVLQVHYLHVNKFKSGKVKDSSGLEIVLDKTNKRYLAGIYLLADGFTPIPPHQNRSHIDMGCLYSEGPVFFPFRFRVHAHKLGVVITGYRVRNDKWTLIGRGDPQRPQAFYPVFHDIDIRPGDTVMGRCTFNSTTRNTTTLIGPTHNDEMCNFYIMYFYDSTIKSRSSDSFPCEEVTSDEIYSSYPEDSDIALNVMEEANRIKFAHYGVKELSYVPVKSWPYDGEFPFEGEMPLTVGQISGVAMLPNDSQLIILHRADRYWDSRTFNWKNIVIEKYQTPIADNTMIWMDRISGNVRKSKGKNMFYLPHGITIDRKGFIWVTDVASHQVYKLSPDLEVVMTLGDKFLPGSGYKRFCKPTDVAVMPNGDFFVGDGYCNNRVLKFNSEGTMLLQISADRKPNIGLFPKPNFMSVVHSVAVDTLHKRLFVADRENGRVLVFHTTNGVYMQQIKVPQGAVYAVAYNPNQGGVLHFVTGPLSDEPVTLSGYTYSFISNSIVSQWAPEGGFTLPHDLAVTKDNQDTFVVEINPFKVWKFTQKSKSPRKRRKK